MIKRILLLLLTLFLLAAVFYSSMALVYLDWNWFYNTTIYTRVNFVFSYIFLSVMIVVGFIMVD